MDKRLPCSRTNATQRWRQLFPSLRQPSWLLSSCEAECSNEQPRAKPKKEHTNHARAKASVVGPLPLIKLRPRRAAAARPRRPVGRARREAAAHVHAVRAAVRHLSKEPARRCMSYAVAGGPRATRVRRERHAPQPAAVYRPGRGLREGPRVTNSAPGRGERPGGLLVRSYKARGPLQEHGWPPRAVGAFIKTTQSGLPANCGGSRRRPPRGRDAARAVPARRAVEDGADLVLLREPRGGICFRRAPLAPVRGRGGSGRYKSAPGRLRFVDEAARARFEIGEAAPLFVGRQWRRYDYCITRGRHVHRLRVGVGTAWRPPGRGRRRGGLGAAGLHGGCFLEEPANFGRGLGRWCGGGRRGGGGRGAGGGSGRGGALRLRGVNAASVFLRPPRPS